MRTYRVRAADREPLLDFMRSALREAGCQIIHASPPDEAPFRITFETPLGERLGIIAYAFLANSKATKNRPADEHRFQLKYGSKEHGAAHTLWQDPFGLYTTLLVGINTERGFFIGADPVLHSPTKFFISVEFKERHVEDVLRHGWYAWERDVRTGQRVPQDDRVEVLVGGVASSFLRYVRFERETVGEDQGHRQLLAERDDHVQAGLGLIAESPEPYQLRGTRLHSLAREFDLSETEILDVISSAKRLHMAVRGWVAETHLERELRRLPGIVECKRIDEEGSPDLRLRLDVGHPIHIECKNVLRTTAADGSVKLDFQRTRASVKDPCTRYYQPGDFDVVAACLHAVTERWEYRYALTAGLPPHARCQGRLSNNVRIDHRWTADALNVLRSAALTA